MDGKFTPRPAQPVDRRRRRGSGSAFHLLAPINKIKSLLFYLTAIVFPSTAVSTHTRIGIGTLAISGLVNFFRIFVHDLMALLLDPEIKLFVGREIFLVEDIPVNNFLR